MRRWYGGRGWLGVLALALLSSGAPAQEPPGPASPEVSQYLGRTPVSLLDWGMLRLERDLQEVARQVVPGTGRNGALRVGTLYRPFDRRVVAYVSLQASARTRTEEQCRELFSAVREQLLSGAPAGAEGAEWYLKRIFGSDARRAEEPPAGYGGLLLDMVLLEVTLRVPPGEAFSDGSGKLACAGRLDAETAQLVPPLQLPRSQG